MRFNARQVGMKMKRATLLLLLMAAFSPCGFTEEATRQEDMEQFMATVLESNFEETPYTALVKVTAVERAGDLMLYPTYRFKCEVLETFKGRRFDRVEYLRGLESTPKAFPIGKSQIVSLFYNQEMGAYYMGDNAYDLPVSDRLLEAARRLMKKNKRGSDP